MSLRFPRSVASFGRRPWTSPVCESRVWGGFRLPFPPCVAHKLLLSALTAAIKSGIKSARHKRRGAMFALDGPDRGRPTAPAARSATRRRRRRSRFGPGGWLSRSTTPNLGRHWRRGVCSRSFALVCAKNAHQPSITNEWLKELSVIDCARSLAPMRQTPRIQPSSEPCAAEPSIAAMHTPSFVVQR